MLRMSRHRRNVVWTRLSTYIARNQKVYHVLLDFAPMCLFLGISSTNGSHLDATQDASTRSDVAATISPV